MKVAFHRNEHTAVNVDHLKTINSVILDMGYKILRAAKWVAINVKRWTKSSENATGAIISYACNATILNKNETEILEYKIIESDNIYFM